MTLRRLVGLFAFILTLTSTHTAVAGEGEFDRDGSYKTTNFRTTAATREMAEKFGDMAEHYRREKAREWLGEEMPNWSQRCPLKVEIRMKDTGGATTFTFGSNAAGRSAVLSQQMHIFGEQKQLLDSVLPHEVTHTVLAYHFGQAVPRWADEGGSVLSENENECFTHDIRCRELLNSGRGIRLRVLLAMMTYPKDMIVVYAQGYSICDYLINQHGGRAKFLKFVRAGMKNDSRNWESAVRESYGFESVDDLEEKWIESLRQPPQRVAKAKDRAPTPTGGTTALASRSSASEVRMSGLSAVPKLEAPAVVRGVAPDRDERPRQVEAKPANRNTDQPPPIALLLPPEHTSRLNSYRKPKKSARNAASLYSSPSVG